MPKYTYIGSGTKKFGKYAFTFSGEIIETDQYFTDPELSLLDHAPAVAHQPANTIYEGGVVSPASGEIEIDQSYRYINVYNDTGAVVNVLYNGLSGESATRIEVEDGKYWTIDNLQKNVGTIVVDGAGADTLKVIQND